MINEQIRDKEIRLIGENGEQLGIMTSREATNGYVPFIITEELKMFYYRGLQQWNHIKDYLRDTCLTAQVAPYGGKILGGK